MAAPTISTRKMKLGEKKLPLKRKDTLAMIKSHSTEFLANRQHANNLVDIISLLETAEDDILVACVRAFHRIFVQLLKSSEMYFDKLPTEKEDLNDLSQEEQYKLWLRERYHDVCSKLIELLTHSSQNVQELSLCTLMKFVEIEGHTPLKKISEKHLFFPAPKFETIVTGLLSDSCLLINLIDRFQEFLEYDDVRYYTMKFFLKHLKERSAADVSDTFLNNGFALLKNLAMPTPKEEEKLINFLSKPPDLDDSLKINTYKEHKKLFTTLWIEFLRKRELPASLYKDVLLNLHEKVMPFMTSPLLLSDFLTESYNIGGAISVLALNGLFILVNTYNLNYPDFYKKLYALFEPSIFHVKYHARFFFLSDLFLSSTHLPAYLVAAFIKRLARLALTAPPCGLLIVVPFIYNLLRRHQSCQRLLHRSDAPTDVTCDPFKSEESDPAKCDALESSLWELKCLQSHYYHAVVNEAKKIDQPLPKAEFDLSSVLENTVDDLMSRERKKKFADTPMNFEPPKGIFASSEDKMKDFWTLD